MARRNKIRRAVTLPWENRNIWLSELISGRRWRPLFLLLALFTATISIWKVADRRAQIRLTRAAIAEVQRAVKAFRTEMGRCPRSTTELLHPPRASAHYLDELPNDGWGQQLFIRCFGGEFSNETLIISAGPSGSFAEDDNVF